LIDLLIVLILNGLQIIFDFILMNEIGSNFG